MQKSQSHLIISAPQMKFQQQPQDVLKNKQESQSSKNSGITFKFFKKNFQRLKNRH